jgi:hypothetical protein
MRRERPDELRIFNVENFTAASRATYTHNSVEMPSSSCSNTV